MHDIESMRFLQEIQHGNLGVSTGATKKTKTGFRVWTKTVITSRKCGPAN